jgi:hypothetical protein
MIGTNKGQGTRTINRFLLKVHLQPFNEVIEKCHSVLPVWLVEPV